MKIVVARAHTLRGDVSRQLYNQGNVPFASQLGAIPAGVTNGDLGAILQDYQTQAGNLLARAPQGSPMKGEAVQIHSSAGALVRDIQNRIAARQTSADSTTLDPAALPADADFIGRAQTIEGQLFDLSNRLGVTPHTISPVTTRMEQALAWNPLLMGGIAVLALVGLIFLVKK